VTQLLLGVGSGRRAPGPPSSAAAVGMETSSPRAGSQLALAATHYSTSCRADLLRMSSRDELAEMAASSQGKGGRSRKWPRGAAFLGSEKVRAPRWPGLTELPGDRECRDEEGAWDSPLTLPLQRLAKVTRRVETVPGC
jgi:hypothetical protein